MGDSTGTRTDLTALLERQRAYFKSGATRPHAFRRDQLNKLERSIRAWEEEILAAVWNDLKKGEFEGFSTEIGVVRDEKKLMRRRFRRWMKQRRVASSVVHFPASSRIVPAPKGVVGIMSPWNYPFQLLIAPLVPAIAAGNCVMLKPSEASPNTEEVLRHMIRETFDPAYVSIVTGDNEVGRAFSELPLDHLFFTGSTAIGRKVAVAAAQNLTPTTLELGGKSPAIVDGAVDLEVVARRIVWGKLINAGQTCVAPDYIVACRTVVDDLVQRMSRVIEQFFGPDPRESEDYGRIISSRHFDRLVTLLERSRQRDRIVHGGRVDRDRLYIEPTVVRLADWESPLMEEELFGPIIPVLEYDDDDTLIERLQTKEHPLALYLFTRSQDLERRVVERLQFGGATINDTVVHLVNPRLPFGGVGSSGYGSYHGRYGFDAFSHYKSIKKRGWLDIPLKYPPYGDRAKLIRRVMG